MALLPRILVKKENLGRDVIVDGVVGRGGGGREREREKRCPPEIERITSWASSVIVRCFV
jgi:hypothetical protein